MFLMSIRMSIGDTLFSNVTPPSPIIDNILSERQAVMLLGSEKAGKSVFLMQLLKSICNGTTFLDTFSVENHGPIVYVQAEGDEAEFKTRLSRMCSVDPIDPRLFCHVYRKFLPLDITSFRDECISKIREARDIWNRNPLVIGFDSIYKLCIGNLINNEDIRKFTNMIDLFIEEFNCAVILIHHESKEQWDQENRNYLDRGDRGAYGSVYLRAYVDHILYLKNNKKTNIRTFTCETQRSGSIDVRMDLKMIQPDPLYFCESNNDPTSIRVVETQFKNSDEPLSVEGLEKTTGLHRNTVDKAVRDLVRHGKIKTVTPLSWPRLYLKIQ